jgi:peptide/nickel transport system permease protein
MRTRTAILVGLLAGLHLVLLFAGFFAPYDPTAQNRELPYAPPTRLHFKDSSGFHLRPFVYAWTSVLGGNQPESYQDEYK